MKRSVNPVNATRRAVRLDKSFSIYKRSVYDVTRDFGRRSGYSAYAPQTGYPSSDSICTGVQSLTLTSRQDSEPELLQGFEPEPLGGCSLNIWMESLSCCSAVLVGTDFV